MILIAALVFGFSTWAVFSKHFCDGLITKHFLVFSAITAFLTVLDPLNTIAALSSLGFLICGMGYWFYKNIITARWHLLD